MKDKMCRPASLRLIHNMEKIFYKNTLIAIRLKTFRPGSNPVTDAKECLQVMAIKRRPGEAVPPHWHVPRKRITSRAQECLVIRRGKIKVSLFGPDKKFFKYLYLKTGQALVVLAGGHGVEYLEPTEIIELKNGPFRDDKQLI